MDEINEQTKNMKQIQEALATPIGAATDFDEVYFHTAGPQYEATRMDGVPRRL